MVERSPSALKHFFDGKQTHLKEANNNLRISNVVIMSQRKLKRKKKQWTIFFNIGAIRKKIILKYQEDCVKCENATDYYQEVPKSSI